ncbi:MULTISPECIES: ribonuclease R [unclassified Streptococcus]|uniref:ribonuclease R n=1 Tax=unclassified Streptococcus TaxID=2608887 RepID=UPI00359F0A6F
MKEQLLTYLQEHGKSSVHQLAEGLDMATSAGFRDLVKTISKLESQGRLTFDDQGNIALNTKKPKRQDITLTGIFRANKAGFGFVSVDEAENDLFVGRNDVGHALDGDTVEVAITKVGDRLKGTAAEVRVVKVVKRALTTVVGKVILDNQQPDYIGYMTNKNQKIQQRIYLKPTSLVLEGSEIVKIAIETYPSRQNDYFVASIRDIIGHEGDVGIDVLEVLESMDIVSEFPAAALAEADALPDVPQEKDYVGRVDLRQELTFTIDGADAKDLDDAVHIKRLDNGNFELGVHIADVSYYVTEGSELNKEALKRGISVYVTDRVVPMLPERLSNGICSLNPQVDRLTQSAIMEIDRQGRVVDYQICQSVIKTTYRMTYTDVNGMLAGDEALLEQYHLIAAAVRDMAELHRILKQMRERRGSLNFDTRESKILVDEKGLPLDVVVRERGVAERLIESFMLAANECVAQHFNKLNLPFIYRIHEEPKAEKLQKFIDYASLFGVQVRGTASKISQEALQDVMKHIEGQPGSDVLSMMLLRSMQQARYSAHNHGHYGLAAAFYTHFTSPIRRYPDLLVHRLIREYGHLTAEQVEHFEQIIPEIASQSSALERRAIDAERVVEAMKKAEYMEKHVGEDFEGIISSVVKFGLFVELPNTIEGLIHVTNLPEYYHYNERTLSLHGEKSGVVFRVGQPIRVKLTRADKETGDIDFDYLPSDLDVREKPAKSDRTSRARRQHKKRHEDKGSDSKSHRLRSGKAVISQKEREQKKGKKLKDKAKKGSKHGKGAGKCRRAK